MEYARLSLTDRCNFRCIYCMPHEGVPFISHAQILSYEEILHICGIMTSLGITRFKITGGEPLCRKGAVGFIRDLARLPGVAEVTLTTNGAFLEPHLEDLAKSGLRGVTFSCDAFVQETFAVIARTSTVLDTVKHAMERTAALGLRVKINTVPLKGYNDEQLVPLARFALERGYHIRFIELMPVGNGRALSGVPQKELFASMEREFGALKRVRERTGNGPAVVYSVAGYAGRIGFIAAISERFCDSCNRVRLTSTGFLKTCLCHDAGVDLRTPARNGASDEDLRAMILKTVVDKPAGHAFFFTANGEKDFFMNSVGG
jgi:cyclic pyranopterin phosphate synthase